MTVILDPEFDAEKERFQLVRMNVIRGKMDPQAFYNLYSKLADKYSDAVMQDAFGFAEEAEFKRLIAQTAKMLPDKDAAGEVQGSGVGNQDRRRAFEAAQRDVHQVRRHAAVRLHDLRPRRPALDVAEGRGQDDERARPHRHPCASTRTAPSTTSLAASDAGACKGRVCRASSSMWRPRRRRRSCLMGIAVAPTKDNLEKVAAL